MSPLPPAAPSRREDRLKAALRDNLRRRKDAARTQADQMAEDLPQSGRSGSREDPDCS